VRVVLSCAPEAGQRARNTAPTKACKSRPSPVVGCVVGPEAVADDEGGVQVNKGAATLASVASVFKLRTLLVGQRRARDCVGDWGEKKNRQVSAGSSHMHKVQHCRARTEDHLPLTLPSCT